MVVKNVSEDTCHKRTTRVLLVMGLFLTVATISGWLSLEAKNKASEVHTANETHEAAQTEREKHVDEKLDDIQVTVKAFDDKLDKVLIDHSRHSGGD